MTKQGGKSWLERIGFNVPSRTETVTEPVNKEGTAFSESKSGPRFTDTLRNNEIGKPMLNEWSMDAALTKGYKTLAVLYACIEIISDSVASVPLVVYTRSGDSWDAAPDHPLQILLDKPNPFMSAGRMKKMMSAHLLLGGNAIWSKIRGQVSTATGVPLELWPLMPSGVKVVPGADEFIKEYRWDLNGKKIIIDAVDIIHFMQIDPGNMYWGIGSLQAIWKTLESDMEAQAYQQVGMKNRGVVSGILSFKQPLTTDQYTQARASVNTDMIGAENARKVLVLGSEASYTKMGLTPEEMDFVESRKLNRDDIVIGMRVPPPMVGIYENATLANIETSRKIFWLDRMVPLLSGMEDVLNLSLVPDFGDPQDLYIGFDLGQVDALQANLKEQIENLGKLIQAGVRPDAAAAMLDLSLTEADFVPPAGQPVGQPMPEPSEEVTKLFHRAARRSLKAARRKSGRKHAIQTASLDAQSLKAHWKGIDTRRSKWEDKCETVISDLFKSQQKVVIDAVKAGAKAKEIRTIIERDMKGWKEPFMAIYKSGLLDFAEQQYDKLAQTRKAKAAAWTRLPSWVLSEIEWVVGEKITRMSDHSKSIIDEIFRDVAETDLTVDDAVDILTSTFQSWSGEGDSSIDKPRAWTIARTEMATITNFGNRIGALQAANDFEIIMEREWVDSQDERVRDRHQKLRGERVAMNDPYSNGLMYPGDPTGKAEEIIHCRCVEIYITVD